MGIQTLKGATLFLRAVEPEDLDAIYVIENQESLWAVGETLVPYSKHILKKYLANAHRDIYDVRQLRLAIIEETSQRIIGLVDLFDFDPHHLRAGVGIVISSTTERRKGYALEAVQLVSNYCHQHLKLHQLYANIQEDNKGSVSLFEKASFTRVGIKKDWRRRPSIDGTEVYINEYLYQLIF